MAAGLFNELLEGFHDLWLKLDSRQFDLQWHHLRGHKMVVSGDPFSGSIVATRLTIIN